MIATAEHTWSPAERAEELASLTAEDKAFLRDAAKNNLYILCKGILGYPDINPSVHQDLCKRVCQDGEEDSQKRRLFLLPRAHLKSTIITIGNSIRLVLKAPEYTRIMLASETATQAGKFLSEIKKHWESNDLLRDLFPELVPERLTGPGSDWSSMRATINREAGHREPHWQAIGVGGAITGSHFSHIHCDDLIGLEAYRSPARMEETIRWSDSIEPLLINQHRDWIDWVGTRWARNDLYEHIMDFYGDDIAVYTRSAIEDGEIIFPELHTWKEYERLQTKNPDLWYAQYENNPIHGGPKDLPSESLGSYELSFDRQEARYRLVDGSWKQWKVADLDRVITVDPNSGSPIAPDMAAITASGLSPDDEQFALETWSDRTDPESFCQRILQMAKRWRPRVVGIEKAGQQNTEFYFKKLCQEDGFHVQVVPLEPKKRKKEERIRYTLQPRIASGKLFLLPSQTVLRKQIADFPNNIIVDELDAFAYTGDIHRTPADVDPSDALQRQNRVLKLVMSSRNPRTGY